MAGDPFPAFAWMRKHAPAYLDEAHGVWGITRYADLKDVSKDPQTFSSAGGIRPDTPPVAMMIDMDAPEHQRRRRLVSSGFTPRRVREGEGWIRRVCDEILDRVCESGECDFVADISAQLPLIAIGDLLGFEPSARDDLLRWSDDLLKAQGSNDPAAWELAMSAFGELCRVHHRSDRRAPAYRAGRRPDRNTRTCRDRRRSPRRRVTHPRVPPDPDRRRRDDQTRH